MAVLGQGSVFTRVLLHVAASMHHHAHTTFTLESGGGGSWRHWPSGRRSEEVGGHNEWSRYDSHAKSLHQPWRRAGAGKGRRTERESTAGTASTS